MLPAGHESELRLRRGLRDRYSKLEQSTSALTSQEAQQGLNALASPNYYDDVLSGTVHYGSTFVVRSGFNAALKDLLAFAFQLLTELKNAPSDTASFRDELYDHAYRSMPGHYCPFCGIDRFDAPHPNMPRHALDHYLSISTYPLFGSYLPNLIPMCSRCNSSFKLAADMLKSDDGSARVCVDPHGAATATISLVNSEPFGNGQLPRWVIDFEPASDAFETWDQVFKVRFRFKESVLDAEFRAWLDVFSQWVIQRGVHLSDSQSVSQALREWASLNTGPNEQGFIKAPMFEMLAIAAARADEMGERVSNFVRVLCSI